MKAFLDSLSKGAKAKVYAALEMLAGEGNRLRFPRSRPLGQGLFEVRVAHPEGPFRILYCFLPGRRIVLLHGFMKRTEEIPQEDRTLALARKPE